MTVAPLQEFRRAVIHVKAIRHIASKLSNQESVGKLPMEIERFLQAGRRKATPSGCRGAHDAGCGANHVNRNYCMSTDVLRHARGKAIDDDGATHVKFPPHPALAAVAAWDWRRHRSEDRGGKSRRAASLQASHCTDVPLARNDRAKQTGWVCWALQRELSRSRKPQQNGRQT